MDRACQRRLASLLRRGPGALLTILLALPLLWAAAPLLGSAGAIAWGELLPPLATLTARTLFYDGIATALAFLLALPAAWALAHASGRQLLILLGLLGLAMVQPPVNFLYGWSQFFRFTGQMPDPQSAADIARCLWTLACWLWPIPAAALGLAARSIDRDLTDQARLDGILRRIQFRSLLGLAAGAAAITLALALQQFVVFEQTNILVVATEVRTAFTMGAFAGFSADLSMEQSARMAVAIAMCLPVTVVVIALAMLALKLLGPRLDLAVTPHLQRRSVLRLWPVPLLLVLTLGLPLAAMLKALARPLSLTAALGDLWPQLSGSFLICGLVAAVCLLLGFLATLIPLRWPLIASLGAFFAGGQFLSLSTIQMLDRPWLLTLYESPTPVILVHVCLFAWINLLIARQFHSQAWRELRQAAAVDGASPLEQFIHILLPLGWHWQLAGAILVFCLSFGETSAVMLLQPQNPQMLMPLLMTWVHMLRYDAMIEGALLLCLLIIALTALAATLARLGDRR